MQTINVTQDLTHTTFSINDIAKRLPEKYHDALYLNYQKACQKKTVRIYCDGVFDMFHLGHVKLFEQVKKMFPSDVKVIIVAGLCRDEDVLHYKGKYVMIDFFKRIIVALQFIDTGRKCKTTQCKIL